MLIKRKDFMTSKDGIVKKMTRSSLAVLTLCSAAIAPNAFAGESLLVDKIVTVKFKLSELEANDGAAKVYAKLQKRAVSSCRADSPTLRYLGQTKNECIEDLMDQFMESADNSALKTVHLARKSTLPVEKHASN